MPAGRLPATAAGRLAWLNLDVMTYVGREPLPDAHIRTSAVLAREAGFRGGAPSASTTPLQFLLLSALRSRNAVSGGSRLLGATILWAVCTTSLTELNGFLLSCTLRHRHAA